MSYENESSKDAVFGLKLGLVLVSFLLLLALASAEPLEEQSVFNPDAGWYFNGYYSSDKCISIWSDKSYYDLLEQTEQTLEYVCGEDEEENEVCNWVSRTDVIGHYFDAKIRIVNNCSTPKSDSINLYSNNSNIDLKTQEISSLKTIIKEKEQVTELVENSWAKNQVSLTKAVNSKQANIEYNKTSFKIANEITGLTIPANSEVIINKTITASGSGEFGIGFAGAFLDPPYGDFSSNSIPIRPDALVAGYSFNGDATDFVSTNNGTVYGASLTENRFGDTNKAYDFDGVNDYIDLGTNINDWSQPFTVGLWINPTGTGESAQEIFESLADNNGVRLQYDTITTGRIEAYVGIGSEFKRLYAYPSPNEWSYIVLTYDGDDVKLYNNGNLTDIEESVIATTHTETTYLGRVYIDSTTEIFNGSIDDVLIYNTALNENEVSKLYQYGRLAGGYGFDGDTNDVSFNQNHGTVNGATLTTNRFGEVDKAYEFGTGTDYINLNNTVVAKSFSVWLYPIIGAAENAVFGDSDSTNSGMPFFQRSSDYWAYSDGSNKSITPIDFNTWQNISGSWDGTHWHFYKDGVFIKTIESGTPIYLNIIGNRSGYSRTFDGKIDDVAIFDYALSETEISELYYLGNYLGTGDWIPPTTSFSSSQVNSSTDQNINLICDDANGSGCKTLNYKINDLDWITIKDTNSTANGLSYDLFSAGLKTDLETYYAFEETSGTSVIDELSNNTGTNVNATINQTGKIDKTYSYNGTTDYVTTTLTGGSAWTFSQWVYLDTIGVNNISWGYDRQGGAGGWNYASAKIGGTGSADPGEVIFVLSSTSAHIEYKSGIDLNTEEWYYLTFSVVDNNRLRIYVNGEKELDSAISFAVQNSKTNFTIGAFNNDGYASFLDGKIDEFGFWNRELTPNEVTELYGVSYADINNYSFLYNGTGLNSIQYYSTDNSDNNETTKTSEFTTYGQAQFNFYDENSLGELNDVTYTISPSINGDSGAALTDSNTLYLNLQGITNQEYTFTFTKDNYSTRTYKKILTQYTDQNINFALLNENLATIIPFKIYKTDETTIFDNTYVEVYMPDNNFIIGRLKTDTLGLANFDISRTDQNYYINVADGNFIYQPVALTVLYPKDEETNNQITELWKLEITQNLFEQYTDLNTEKLIYLLPNIALPFNIKIVDMNGNYFPRTYAKQYPGNPLSNILQPYLVKTANGILTTIRTVSSYDNQPVKQVKIKIYKNISFIGRTLVEEIVTDDKGEALTYAVTAGEYEYELYIDNVYLRTDLITATSSTIYIKINDKEYNVPVLQDYRIIVSFYPYITKLQSFNNLLSQTINFQDFNSTATISKIYITVLNTVYEGDFDDIRTIYSTSYDYNSETIINNIDLNVLNQTLAGTAYDTNGYFIVNVIVTIDDVNYYSKITYKPYTINNVIETIGFGSRDFFGCDSTDPQTPCANQLLIAVFVSFIIVAGVSAGLRIFSPSGLGITFMLIMGIFTYLTYVPILLYGILVVGGIVVIFASRGRFL